MTRKPLPPHGTYARANGSPGIRPQCTCPPCRKAWLRARKAAHVNRQLGRPSIVKAAPARAHLTVLRQTMTWQQIADITCCMRTTLQDIHSGKSQSIRRRTATAVMAVTAQPATEPRLYVDATGSRRRLQALAVLGHSIRVIADEASTVQARLQPIQAGSQPTVTVAARIKAAYVPLLSTPAQEGRGSTLVRRHATAKGWLGPGYWDDDEIDDPNFIPAVASTSSLKKDDVTHLLWCGVPSDEVRARTGASIAYIREIAAELRNGKPRDRSRNKTTATDMRKAA